MMIFNDFGGCGGILKHSALGYGGTKFLYITWGLTRSTILPLQMTEYRVHLDIACT